MESLWKKGRSKGIVFCGYACTDHSISEQCNLQNTSSFNRLHIVKSSLMQLLY